VCACACVEDAETRHAALWIQRINAGTREHGLKYGDFIHGQKLANVALDRKILADLAVTEPYSFKTVVDMARDALLKKHGAAASAT
jgi:large subunit ribosomal protein L20